MDIVLASSSPFRKQLLEKIIPHFECASPDIDESALANEGFPELAQRLSKEKAVALACQFPNALIIGSDQVAEINHQQLQKPKTPEQNAEHLRQCSGKIAKFHTGLCVLNTATQKSQVCTVLTQVKFKDLSERNIQNYIARENALNCAGGFKMEGLGIAMFDWIRGDDPNSLIGLPLIKLTEFLQNEGFEVL